MMLEREERRIVERAQREVDHVAVRIIERQRRAARAAEATPREHGGGVIIRLPRRPADIRLGQVHEAGEDIADRPLAHAAMTEIGRSEEHTSELQSLMRNSYAVFCLKKKHTAYTKMKVSLHQRRQTNKHRI